MCRREMSYPYWKCLATCNPTFEWAPRFVLSPFQWYPQMQRQLHGAASYSLEFQTLKDSWHPSLRLRCSSTGMPVISANCFHFCWIISPVRISLSYIAFETQSSSISVISRCSVWQILLIECSELLLPSYVSCHFFSVDIHDETSGCIRETWIDIVKVVCSFVLCCFVILMPIKNLNLLLKGSILFFQYRWWFGLLISGWSISIIICGYGSCTSRWQLSHVPMCNWKAYTSELVSLRGHPVLQAFPTSQQSISHKDLTP